MKKFKHGQLSRLTSIGKSVLKASSKAAQEKASKKLNEFINLGAQGVNRSPSYATYLLAIKELVEVMGELKGAYMKLGQMLSITEDLFLPKEVTQAFAKLQKNAPPMPRSDIDTVFLKNFGKRACDIFESFDYQAFAAASIGQVHKALIRNGQKVVVKVQYPNVKNAIESDLKNLDKIAALIKLIVGYKADTTIITHELSQSLLRECDYSNELNNIKTFQGLVSDHCLIKVPKVYEEYSTEHILTLEELEGDTFETSQNYPLEDRSRLSQALYNFHLDCLFNKRYIHSDPQNGNYLFRKDKIILLDYGSIKQLDNEFVHNYALLTRSILLDDMSLFKIATVNLQVIYSEIDNETIHLFFDVAKSIYKPFLEEGSYCVPKMNPFEQVKNLKETLTLFKNKGAPHRDFVLLDRANLGLYAKLKTWNAPVDWLSGRQKYQEKVELKALEILLKEPK